MALWVASGGYAELMHVPSERRIHPTVHRYPRAQVNEVLDLLEHGKVHGRAVVVP